MMIHKKKKTCATLRKMNMYVISDVITTILYTTLQFLITCILRVYTISIHNFPFQLNN